MKNNAQAARLSRRTVILALGAGLGGTAAGAAPALAASAGSRTPRGAAALERGAMGDWAAFVGERFQVAGGGTLRLAGVEGLCSGGPTPSGRRCFAALFESVGGPAPEGGRTYALAARSAAPMSLYLGVRAEVRGRSRLVAVFN